MDKIDTIKNLNYVMEKRQHHSSYRALDRKYKTVLKYAPSIGSAIAFSSPGILIAFLYRRYSDKCRRSCGKDKVCYYSCYSIATNKVLKDINRQISKAKRIEDKNKREKTIEKLKKDYTYYTQKSLKFKQKLKKNKEGSK
jgi:hypothetical protein